MAVTEDRKFTKAQVLEKMNSVIGKTLGEVDSSKQFDRTIGKPKITGIAHERQIVDSMSLYNCRNLFFVRLIKEGQDKDLPLLLKYRFPTFVFSNDAQNDLLWWKNKNVDVINTIIDLLDDIPRNPFTGGLGKTEVLSNTTNPVVSKRITQKDRLTYTYGKMTKIHRCKEHY